MNKKVIFVFILPLLFIAGCWDVKEPERMLYVNGVGIDYKNDQYEVYVQIINFTNIAKSEQPTTEEVQAEVGKGTGKTLDEALFNLYHSTDERVFWGHFSYMVFSEDALKQVKLSTVVDSFIRYRETRYRIWLYMTTDKVEEVLLVRPVINKSIILSKLGDPENSFKQESFIEPINIRKLIIHLNEPGHEALVPLVTIKENWKSIEEKIKAPSFAGVGVVTANGFEGTITGDQANGIQWMSNETKRGEITFKEEGEGYTTVVIEKIKVKVKPIVESEKVKFDLSIRVEGYVAALEKNEKTAHIKAGIVKEIDKEIRETFAEALRLDVDVYRLSEQLYRDNVKAWKQFQKNGKIALTEDSIRNLDIKVDRLISARKSFQNTIDEK